MKPKLLISFLLLVFVPLGLLGWLGYQLAKSERETLRRQFLLVKLDEVDNRITSHLEGIESELQKITSIKSLSKSKLRTQVRTQPLVNQMFWLDEGGELVHPRRNDDTPLLASEEDFLDRTRQIWLDDDLFYEASVYENPNTGNFVTAMQGNNDEVNLADSANDSGGNTSRFYNAINAAKDYKSNLPQQSRSQKKQKPSSSQQRIALPLQQAPNSPSAQIEQIDLQQQAESQQIFEQQIVINNDFTNFDDSNFGWYKWYWGSGLHLIFWNRINNSQIIGVELNRSKLLSEIIAILPDTNSNSIEGQVVLVNTTGQPLYKWGNYKIDTKAKELPAVTRTLSEPLSSWQLQYYAPAGIIPGLNGIGSGTLFNILAGIFTAALALTGLALYFYRENSRELREADQRVTFVNQVSHELKTPLTNIRMYAELLENELHDTEEKPRRHLNVIVNESQRLSRLIGNVLTFNRERRGALKLKPVHKNIDTAIQNALMHFTPSFKNKGIEIETALETDIEAKFDPDVLEQILCNLFSNVEKYAPEGEWIRVESSLKNNMLHVSVCDKGPGIPATQREKIFAPFERLNDALTEGVAGSGIGLTIARELARRHGGDVKIVSREQGTCFEVTLKLL